MADVSAVSYSLKHCARVLTAQSAETSRWLVGTCALRDENEVLELQYDADQDRVVCASSYTHPSEVWDIATCPNSDDLLMTVWCQGGTYGVTLWRTSTAGVLNPQTHLGGHNGVIRGVVWNPHKHDQVFSIDEGCVRQWTLSQGQAQCESTASGGDVSQLWCGTMQSDCVLLTAGGNMVQLWDARAMSKPSADWAAHKMPVRSISCAAHNNVRVVTAGDDCQLRFWDLRLLKQSSDSLLDLGGHSHWVWRAQFNPFHDQLIASGSSDSLVNLYHTPQLAGATPTAITRAGDLDGKAHTYDEHEDSVYGVAWSLSDPWLFASLSYDGRLVVNKVPKNTKYKILI